MKFILLFVLLISGCMGLMDGNKNSEMGKQNLESAIGHPLSFGEELEEYRQGLEYHGVMIRNDDKKFLSERYNNYDDGLKAFEHKEKSGKELYIRKKEDDKGIVINFAHKDKALKLLQKSYEYGNMFAAARMGQYYLYNDKEENRFEKAKSFFIKSIATNDMDAFFGLGVIYYLQFLRDKERVAGISSFKFAAKYDNPHAKHNLAVILYEGKYLDKDEDRALDLFLEAADVRIDYSAYVAMKIMLNRIDKKKKPVNIRIIKNDFIYHSYYNYSRWLEFDRHTRADKKYNKDVFEKSVMETILGKYNRKSAKNYYIAAMVLLKSYYGIADYKRAFEYLSDLPIEEEEGYKGLHIGFKIWYQKGLCYYKGIGTKKDLKKAKEIFEKVIKYYDENINGKSYK